jgi:hypothetical protein
VTRIPLRRYTGRVRPIDADGAELEATDEVVFPRDLPALLRSIRWDAAHG